jgi:dimeric dUTPase (all-alpha-NTP-PPase superfamily)
MKQFNDVYVENKKIDALFEEQYGNVNQFMFKNMLSLLVEIGELANETRCFKFWSQRPMSEKEILLEEAADILHHAMSILNYSVTETGVHNLTLSELFEESETVKVYVNDLQLDLFSKDLTGIFLEMYGYALEGQAGMVILDLCHALKLIGCTAEELEEAYYSKNSKNYERQAENY